MLLSRAARVEADAEVEGFGVVFEVDLKRNPVVIDQKGCARLLAAGIGLDPAKVWTDMRP